MKDREVYQYYYLVMQQKRHKQHIDQQISAFSTALLSCDCKDFIQSCTQALEQMIVTVEQSYQNSSRLTRFFRDTPSQLVHQTQYLINSLEMINDITLVIQLLMNYRQHAFD